MTDRLNKIELKIFSIRRKVLQKREELPLGKKFSVKEEPPIENEFQKNTQSK